MIELEFEAVVVQSGSWHFLALPTDLAADLRSWGGVMRGGWGSIKVEASIGATTWSTSIFPAKESKTFLLPIKAEVRKAEQLADGSEATVTLRL